MVVTKIQLCGLIAMNLDSSVTVGEILLRNTTENILQGTYEFASIGLEVRVLCDDHFYGETLH